MEGSLQPTIEEERRKKGREEEILPQSPIQRHPTWWRKPGPSLRLPSFYLTVKSLNNSNKGEEEEEDLRGWRFERGIEREREEEVSR